MFYDLFWICIAWLVNVPQFPPIILYVKMLLLGISRILYITFSKMHSVIYVYIL